MKVLFSKIKSHTRKSFLFPKHIQVATKNTFALLIGLFFFAHSHSQLSKVNSHKEQIPPATPEQISWWNLLHYSIHITPDYNRKYIKGINEIRFSALQSGDTMEIQLKHPMMISKVYWNNIELKYRQRNGSYYIAFPETLKKGDSNTVTIHFEGKPTESKNPPFDNGWIWTRDEKGRPWMNVACQGAGASVWLPCKDLLYDEPDNGILFAITVPDSLIAVANGRFQNKTADKEGTATYTWKVVSPINSYSIIPYIGKYVSWDRTYNGLKKNLDRGFWVLDYNLEKAKKHFLQTDSMLRAFEYWLGPYPFYEDSYKLVEAPMPGMEHQSGIAYGNGFRNGYGGKDFISNSGWGLKWGFILVHESGHEWFGNSVTANNDRHSWIHEGFTKYLETLYTDFTFGKKAGDEYALGTWKRIKSDEPILGSNTSDKYYKGSAMLHMIRQIIGDKSFREWLQKIQQEFYHQTVTTDQIRSSLY